VGTRHAGECQGPPPPERLALTALLEKLFNAHSGAIVEPLDRKAGDLESIGTGWQRGVAGIARPILLKGDPRDYACLRPDRPMIVYGEKDIVELQRGTPDFHAVELPRIVYNRARDRGYVKWSAGWVGGTYRLTRAGDSWTFETISQWIT